MKLSVPSVTTVALAAAVVLQIASYIHIEDQAKELKYRPRAYIEVQEHLIAQQAEMAGHVDTVIFGDSIASAVLMTNNCGVTFNAARAAADIRAVKNIANDTLQHIDPDKIIIAVGTNDAIRGDGSKPIFQRRYMQMIDSLGQRPFALVGIANDKPANETVKSIAHFVPPVPTSMTSDGIHPGAAGSQLWRSQVEMLCKA